MITFAVSQGITPQKSLPMPEPDLRQPSAKSLWRIRDKLVVRIRRDDNQVSGGERNLKAILNDFAAALDDISDQRGQHAPYLGLRSSSQVAKTTGQHA